MSARSWLVVLGVALASSLASLRNGFVYDDVPVAQQDPRIRSPELRRLISLPYWSDDFRDRLYRPVTTLSLAADWSVGRGASLPFHGTNVALHVAVTALVLALALRVLGGGAGPLVAALWFAVHPVHVEAFASVVGRSELLAAAGYLGAVLAFARYLELRGTAGASREGVLAVAVVACAALAFGAKEHALTLPATLAFVAVWGASDRARARRFLASGGPLLLATAVLALAYLAARAAVVGSAFGGGAVAAGLEGLDPAERAMVMLPAPLVWARLLLFPLHLAADYSPDAFEARLAPTWGHAGGLVLAVVAALAAWRLRNRMPGVTFGLAWFAITMAVAANLAVPTGVLIAERALYLPSAGAAVALGALWERVPHRRWRWPATAGLLSLLALRTLERIPVWRDNQRFFATLVRDAPDSYRAHWMLGTWAFRHGAAAAGERELLAAMRIYPSDPVLVAELGSWYLRFGRFDDADRFLSAAIGADTTMADAAMHAIVARMKGGHADSAAALGSLAARRFPRDEALLLAATAASGQAGRPFEKLSLARRLIFLSPGRWEYQMIAAEAALLAGICEEARARNARAAGLAPDQNGPRELAARIAACRAAR